jgi:hypothetical protein
MPKNLAITISGAVSLGSYEAGVLYEIIRTIQHHNGIEQDKTKKIEIDVLVGASAGGMTAAIAVQKLLFEASSLEDPYNNSLYRAWVKDVSFDNLFNLQAGEDPTHSLLSSNHVDAISKMHITDRYATPRAPKQEKHAAAADVIHLGLALSNLNGIDYVRPFRTGGDFCYTRYKDKMEKKFQASNSADDTLLAWDPVRSAAVSCGAFPFAFRVKDLVRHYDDYKSSAFLPSIPKGSFSTPKRIFTYTDGGLFENEPLGMAKNLVDILDPCHVKYNERFYLYVSPRNLSGTTNSRFSEIQASFGNTANTIIASIFNQARFHDWITAEQVNNQVKILDERAARLCEAIIAGEIDLNQLQSVAASLLPLLFGEAQTEQTASQFRLRSQYNKEYAELIKVSGQSVADIWIDAILLLEKAANLGDKDEMQVFGITASEEELASGELAAFLGFFDQTYRDHDYDIGRTKAREFVRGIHLNEKVDLWFPHHPVNNPTAAFEPWMQIRPINDKLNGLQLKDVSKNLRTRFRDRLVDSADKLWIEMGIAGIVRMVLNSFFIKPELNKWLGL